MKLKEIDGILEKMSELRVYFDFGTRALPLLDDVGKFVQEIGPVIEGIMEFRVSQACQRMDILLGEIAQQLAARGKMPAQRFKKRQ